MVLAAAMALATAGQARADCNLAKLAELPLTMRGGMALAPAKLNGEDALFIVDSGAVYSTLSTAGAVKRGLKLEPGPAWLQVFGVGGSVRINLATVKTFALAQITLPDVDFIVGGSQERLGAAGLLGQNVLRVGDVEYDFKGAAMRVFKPMGCEKAELAYWTTPGAASVLTIEPRKPLSPYAIATVLVNGAPVRALFDTGAQASVMTLGAARRAGIMPDSPGVVAGGVSAGLDRRAIRTWIAPVQSFEAGGEKIRNTRLLIGDIGVVGTEAPDMLIGADFFRSHHVLVSNSQSKLYFTYAGGAVFDISQKPAEGAPPPVIPPAG